MLIVLYCSYCIAVSVFVSLNTFILHIVIFVLSFENGLNNLLQCSKTDVNGVGKNTQRNVFKISTLILPQLAIHRSQSTH